ncbi:MAG: aminoacyl-tRNA deacylase [Ardenticatenaceae bacterium]|nr:aminoacyl-tRNA deacylase [Ardenticatenaceae bacterium]
MMNKTLAMKFLEGKKVPYEVIEYPNTMRDAAEIAELKGIPPGQVFKTLVVQPLVGVPKAKPMLVMISADRQLDLKKLAKAVGAKKLKMATHAEAEALTGLQVGGISPLVLVNKGFTIYLDVVARAYSHIYISAAQKGLNVKVAVKDLLKVTAARWIDTAVTEN